MICESETFKIYDEDEQRERKGRSLFTKLSKADGIREWKLDLKGAESQNKCETNPFQQ